MNPLRTLLALLSTLVITVLMGTLAVLAIAGTPQGSRWVLRNLSELVGEKLALTGVQGTLLTGITLARLELQIERITVVAERAEIALGWPALLSRRVSFTTLRAQTLEIRVAPRPPDEPETPVQPLLLPVVLQVASLEVERLLVRTATLLEMGSVRLQGELVDGTLVLPSVRVALPGFRAQAQGTFNTGEPFALNAKLAWELPLTPNR